MRNKLVHLLEKATHPTGGSSVMVIIAITACLHTGCAFGPEAFADSHPFLLYEVRVRDADLEVLEVRGSVFGSLGDRVSFDMPDPGRGPGLDPIGFEARGSGGRILGVSRDGDRWTVDCGGRDFTFTYGVVLTIEDRYCAEVRGMLSMLGGGRTRMMGRDVFLVPVGPFEDGVIVDVDTGDGSPVFSTWECVGGRMMVPDAGNLPSTLMITGDYRISECEVAGTRLQLAVGGEWSFGDSELLEVIRSVVEKEIEWFGSSPYAKHLFVCDGNPVRGGAGFDHYGVHFGGSILLLLDRRLGRSGLYDSPMSIVAHEFFHNWHGETIRAAGDDILWFIEGATVYFSYRALTATRIISHEQHGKRREAIERRYLENPRLGGVSLISAANSDLSDKDMVNLLYDGGYLAAEAIDLRIDELTSGGMGLIDVLRGLYRDNPGGVILDEEALIEAIARYTGCDLSRLVRDLSGAPSPRALALGDVSS